MTVWQAIVLGIVQGLTEFLPVSSSAHLIIMPWLLGWDSPGLAFDAALHVCRQGIVDLIHVAELGIAAPARIAHRLQNSALAGLFEM